MTNMNNWQHHLEMAHYEALYRQQLAEHERLAQQVAQGGFVRGMACVLLRMAHFLQRQSERMINNTAPHPGSMDTTQVTARLTR